jgi:hypothetical protein
MSDPRDPNYPYQRHYEDVSARSTNAIWGWIAGLVFLVIILALIFGPNWSNSPNQTAGNPPAQTTGSAPPAKPMTPPAATPAAPPASTPAPANPSAPR